MADGLMGLMQPGPTLYEADRLRKQRGSMGLLGTVGEPMSYAPGPVGLLGNALLSAQYLTGEKPIDEGLSGMAMLTALLQGTKVAPIINNAIKVYHGSPHAFTKASSEHIGTGEGAQAYGHGLYWAENPGVARDYANRLSADKKVDLVHFDHDKGYGALDPKTKSVRWFHNEKDAKEFVRDTEYNNLYEANLRWPDAAREAADPLGPQHFLDWDKPLSGMPKQVQGELAKVKTTNDNLLDLFLKSEYASSFPDAGDVRIAKRIAKDGDPEEIAAWIAKGGTAGSARNLFGNADTGAAWYERLTNKHMQLNPGISKPEAQRLASAEIRANTGIPGITYLDAGSRAAGQGTRNYVTFDDALIELLKRNGISLAGQ